MEFEHLDFELDLDLSGDDFNLDDIDLDLSGIDLGLGLDDLDADLPSKTEKLKNRYVKPKPHTDVATQRVKFDHCEAFVTEMLTSILAGERIHAVVSGNFIFGDFFEALVRKAELPINKLTISTLSFSQENIDSFENLMDSEWLEELNIVVSDYFWSHNRRSMAYVYEKLDKNQGDRFQLAVASVHTKITLMILDGKKYVINGSANLRSSRSVEEFSIEQDDALYDFHSEWHNSVLEKYATIKKSIRGEGLFELVK